MLSLEFNKGGTAALVHYNDNELDTEKQRLGKRNRLCNLRNRLFVAKRISFLIKQLFCDIYTVISPLYVLLAQQPESQRG